MYPVLVALPRQIAHNLRDVAQRQSVQTELVPKHIQNRLGASQIPPTVGSISGGMFTQMVQYRNVPELAIGSNHNPYRKIASGKNGMPDSLHHIKPI
jgi:hypothetical protein